MEKKYFFNKRLGKAGIVLPILIFLSLIQMSAQQIRINEFLSLNETSEVDEDGAYSDWIEIYNPTSSSINLSGYSLTDDATVLQKWVFPNVTIEANNYLIVFASGKDRSIAGNELHTNFKLSGGGEYLGFYDNSGIALTIFDPAYPEQQADVSYGFFEDGYISFADPTPNASNTTSTSIQLPSPLFNKKHGYYDTEFSLEMSCDVPGASIYYTLDGSVPSSSNGSLYSSAIAVSKTSIVRAVSVMSGAASSKATTASYMFVDDIIHQPNNPAGYPSDWGPFYALSGNAPADYEMDSELIGDADFAERVKTALKDIPTISLVTDKDHFFNRVEDVNSGGIYMFTGSPIDHYSNGVGFGWERPVSFEYFDAKDSVSLQIDCGVKLHGGHSRRPEKSPKHSLRLVFSSDYGPSRLKFPLFGSEATDDYNAIVLRAGFCNAWVHHSSEERNRAQFTRDAWAKDVQLRMGHLGANNSFAHLYINGIYWGLYNPTERLDDDFGASYLEGSKEEFDVIKDYTEVGDGNITAWNNMMSIVRSDMSTSENYQKIQGNNPDGTPNESIENYLDVVNLIDYMLINMYGGNTDWDHHNWVAIRNRVKPGKGFNFICWDSEHVNKTIGENVINENNSNCPSEIFQSLRANEDFKRLVADRVQKYCYNGGLLSPEEAKSIWMERVYEVEKSVDAESARWGDYRRDVHPYQTSGPFELYTTDGSFLTQQDFMLNTYFPQRTSAFVNQMKNADLFPNVTSPTLKVNNADVGEGIINKNDALTMSAPQGTVYYTLDGSDPVIWESNQSIEEVVLINESVNKKVIVPTSAIDATWKSDTGFDDSTWKTSSGAPGGVGYENGSGYESLISLNIGTDMLNNNGSCYIRIPFNVTASDKADKSVMKLGMNYDDGFIVYLNGVKIAEQNAPVSPAYNSLSTVGHEANGVEFFDVSAYITNLNVGENILAIQGLNLSLASSDFIILPSLSLSNEPMAGGSVSPNALSYSGSINITNSVRVKARAYYNGEWSAVNDKFLIVPDDYQDLKITEVHYHPQADEFGENDDYEFIEIKNTGDGVLDIGGMEFADGIEFKFPMETELQPGNFIVLAANDDGFYDRYGFWPFDDYKGQLNNDGEWVKLVTSLGDTVVKFKFNDGIDWPQTPDGVGNSLVPTEYNPINEQNSPADWRASYEIGGSPGEDDFPSSSIECLDKNSLAQVVLSNNYPNPFNEVTYIDYQLPEGADVQLSLFDLTGRVITILVDGYESEGLHQVTVEGLNLDSGVYFYRLVVKQSSGNVVITKKMLKK